MNLYHYYFEKGSAILATTYIVSATLYIVFTKGVLICWCLCTLRQQYFDRIRTVKLVSTKLMLWPLSPRPRGPRLNTKEQKRTKNWEKKIRIENGIHVLNLKAKVFHKISFLFGPKKEKHIFEKVLKENSAQVRLYR